MTLNNNHPEHPVGLTW